MGESTKLGERQHPQFEGKREDEGDITEYRTPELQLKEIESRKCYENIRVCRG